MDIVIDDGFGTVRYHERPAGRRGREDGGETAAPGRELESLGVALDRLAGELAARVRAHIGGEPCATG